MDNEFKICNFCHLSKPIKGFHGAKCADCQALYQKEYRLKNKDTLKKNNSDYYQNNKEIILENQKEYNRLNPEVKRKSAKKSYYKNHEKSKADNRKRVLKFYYENQNELSQKSLEYYYDNREARLEYHYDYMDDRLSNDSAFKLRKNISVAINKALKRKKSNKNGESILNYFPYTIQELKSHIEAQFEPWMTWNNWGVYRPETWDDNDQSTWTWQIDHIIPQSKLLYISMEDENFKKCWALENLRPYSAKQNILDNYRRV